METKPRILYLQKILLERTDEENPLSTTQLINILNDEYGISAHRTTVTKDIAALQEFGMDIVTIHSTQSKYFVASRKFELPELKLLIDAVESSKFITKKKSETLIKKIHTMTSPGQVAKLKRNNYVVNRIKPDNEQIYYIIDAINDAINAGKQISFQYYDYTGLKKKVLKNKGEIYKLSPYKLLWCGDYYYVLGYSEKKSKVINFRTMSRQNFPSDRWYSFCRTSRMLAWTSSLACLISSMAMTAAGLISGTVFLCASSSSQLGMSSRFMILLHLVSLLTNSIELMHTNVKKSCCASSNSFLPRFMISFSSGPAVQR